MLSTAHCCCLPHVPTLKFYQETSLWQLRKSPKSQFQVLMKIRHVITISLSFKSLLRSGFLIGISCSHKRLCHKNLVAQNWSVRDLHQTSFAKWTEENLFLLLKMCFSFLKSKTLIHSYSNHVRKEMKHCQETIFL